MWRRSLTHLTLANDFHQIVGAADQGMARNGRVKGSQLPALAGGQRGEVQVRNLLVSA